MSINACAGLVRSGDSDRFAATMTAEPLLRGPLFVLYALNLEVAKAPWVTQEAMIAEMRLQWWRDVVEESAAGKAARAHEVAGPLAELIGAGGIDVSGLDRMIAARRWDIYKDAFEDQAHMDDFIDRTSGHLMWAAAQVCGAPNGLEAMVRHVAYGHGIARWLQAVPAYVSQGRIPLLDGRDAGVRALAQRGLARLDQAQAARFGPALPAVRVAWQARVILQQAVAAPERVAEGTLGTSEFRKRAMLLAKSLARRW